MLAALDLAWIHWPSAIFGVILLFGGFYGAAGLTIAAFRAVRWLRRWRAPVVMVQRGPAPEEVRTLDSEAIIRAHGMISRSRARRELGSYLPTAPRIASVRDGTILDRKASEKLWYEINGGRDTV